MTQSRLTVIEELSALQRAHGYLRGEEMRRLAHRMQTPLYQLHGVASFYPHFRLTPPPAAEVLVCDDLSCHLRGGATLREAAEARVADAGLAGVELRNSSCLGQCDRAPACSVNDVIRTGVSVDSLLSDIEAAVHGRALSHGEREAPVPPLAIDPYAADGRYGALRALVAGGDPAAALPPLKAAELRGMGGAGFGTALKWELVRKASSTTKYIVCNADEREPGTLKDRFLLTHVPPLVVEGMMIAGLVTGARTGVVYIRHEYHAQRDALEREIATCRRAGLLGGKFDLSVFVSPGGYICGEESALLEALEGKRAEPRNKPPFPVVAGLWGEPTVINNVETFAYVPGILVKGPEWFRAQGRGGAPGLKFMGVSGDVARPGVFEIALGTPAREVIFERAGGMAAGRRLTAFAPSGCSSGFLPASMVDVPLDFAPLAKAGSMLGSGALVVFADDRCMLDVALNAVQFFKRESCGKCVPCRVGSAKLVDILDTMAHGRGRMEEFALVDEIAHATALTSICGLGQVVPSPIRSALAHFREEIHAHVRDGVCPTGVCPMPAGVIRS